MFIWAKPVGTPVSIVPRPWTFWISTSFRSATFPSWTNPPRIEPLAISTSSCWAFSRTVSASGASIASRMARRDWWMTARRSEASRTSFAYDSMFSTSGTRSTSSERNAAPPARSSFPCRSSWCRTVTRSIPSPFSLRSWHAL